MRWRARLNVDIENEPIGVSPDGKQIFLRDLWPAEDELPTVVKEALNRDEYIKELLRTGALQSRSGTPSNWRAATYTNGTKPAPTFNIRRFLPICRRRRRTLRQSPMPACWCAPAIASPPITSAPAGAIDPKGSAGVYLQSKGVDRGHFKLLRQPTGQRSDYGARYLCQHPLSQPVDPRL